MEDILILSGDFLDRNITSIDLKEVPHIPFKKIKILIKIDDNKDTIKSVFEYDEILNTVYFRVDGFHKEYCEIAVDIRDIKFQGLPYICSFTEIFKPFCMKIRKSNGSIVLVKDFTKNNKWQCYVQWFHNTFQIFDYINSIKLSSPEIVEQNKIHHIHNKIYSPKQKERHNIYLQRRFTITGNEKKRRKKSTVVYSTAEWSVRGHFRHLKSGKEVWIEPQLRKRKNLTATTKSKKSYIVS